MSVKEVRIHQARRAAIRNGLIEAGMDLELAERWCDSWEVEATRQRITRSFAYWELGRRWIDAQRATGKAPRS